MENMERVKRILSWALTKYIWNINVNMSTDKLTTQIASIKFYSLEGSKVFHDLTFVQQDCPRPLIVSSIFLPVINQDNPFQT